MSEPPTRRYTDREIRAILRRTVELQADHSDDGLDQGAPDGTTLDQLQQAAIEMGLDPALIAQAATEIGEDASVGRGLWLFGGPWSVDSDHIIEGTVTEEDWDTLVEEIRASTGRFGFSNIFGRAFDWFSPQPYPLRVSVTPHRSNTRVRVTANFGVWARLCYLLSTVLGLFLMVFMIACFGKAGINGATLLSLLAGSSIASLVGARFAVGPLATRKRRETHALIATIERWIAQPHQRAVTPAPIRTLPVRTTVEPELPLEQVNRLS